MCPHAHITSLEATSLWMTVTDGYKTLKRKGHLSGQIRQEEVLARAVVIEGRKEWYCRFVQRPTCGQERSAGDATPTFWQGVACEALAGGVFEKCAQLVGVVCVVRRSGRK